MNGIGHRTSIKRNHKGGCHNDVVSIQLHGVSIIDETNVSIIDSIYRTYNSVSRCSFKRFNQMGLKHMLKSSSRKRTGFWSIDKDIGSPIQGAVESAKAWMSKHNLQLDSILLQNAVMDGYRKYMSFMGKVAKWETPKANPAFGEVELRSSGKLSKDEFQLTRNGSFTVVGKARGGNPKFKFDLDTCTMTYTHQRKRIGFSFKSHRFSKKGFKHISELVKLMSEGKLPVTVTLKGLGHGKYTTTLSYSATTFAKLKGELNTKSSNIVSGIWFSDDIVHHQIVDKCRGKVLREKTYRMDKLSGERDRRKYIEALAFAGNKALVKKLNQRTTNKVMVAAREVLSEMFTANKHYGVTEVIVESTRHKSKRDFNNSYISFNDFNVKNGTGKPCFIPTTRFMGMVKRQCALNVMKLSKIDGTFIQLRAIMSARSMSEAIRNACSDMISRRINNEKPTHLTDWARRVLDDPSMLDWVGHLLHNKRNRQARLELKRVFHTRAVEKAVRLIDTKSRRRLAAN